MLSIPFAVCHISDECRQAIAEILIFAVLQSTRQSALIDPAMLALLSFAKLIA